MVSVIISWNIPGKLIPTWNSSTTTTESPPAGHITVSGTDGHTAVNTSVVVTAVNGTVAAIWRTEQSYDLHGCSPADVNRHAKQLKLSGAVYEPTIANPYWWAKRLAKTLGVAIHLEDWPTYLGIPGIPATRLRFDSSMSEHSNWDHLFFHHCSLKKHVKINKHYYISSDN